MKKRRPHKPSRVGIVFHKDPYAAPVGIDIVRLRALAGGLLSRGIATEILAPDVAQGLIEDRIPVRPLARVCAGEYDLIATEYHQSALLAADCGVPMVCRIVRVVDERFPERDEKFRGELLRAQATIARRASAVILNNQENAARWRERYGDRLPIAIIPSGCPARLPEPGPNPYPLDEPAALFLGSIAAPRVRDLLNRAARALKDTVRIHMVGANKSAMYGDPDTALDPLIVLHGEIPEPRLWDYIRHARIGLAPAVGELPFDNDLSKIYYYLRGGVPVLAEQHVANVALIETTRFGRFFRYGDIEDLAAHARGMLTWDTATDRPRVMEYMAREHSWDMRVDEYVRLFASIR